MTAETKKQLNKAEVVELLKEEKAEVERLQKLLDAKGTDSTPPPETKGNLSEVIQFRITLGVLKAATFKAKGEGLTPNDFARKLFMAKMGYK